MNISPFPKPKYLFPGDKPPLDTTIPVVYVGSALLMALLGMVLITSMVLWLSWHDFPFFPAPPSNRPALVHVQAFWQVMAGLVSKPLQGEVFHEYRSYLYQLNQIGMSNALAYRWFLAIGCGLVGGIWTFWVSLKPVGGVRHVRGKTLLQGRQAYDTLKREFGFLSQNGRGSGLILGADRGFDPTNREHYLIKHLKAGTFIEKPESLRRAHSIYLGGTGRGKTQLINYLEVAQLYQRMRNRESVKLFIADTPKGDYVRQFHAHHRYLISPIDADGMCWHIAEDLNNHLVANAFWKGKIPLEDKNPIWSLAAISVCTGVTKVLQEIAPKAWNYGMLAHLLGKPGEELALIIGSHYPEARQVLHSAGDTLASVMFNLGTYTADIIQLGRIHDCFDSKQPVHQASAQALRSSAYLNFVVKDMSSDPLGGNETERIKKATYFKAVCCYLNQAYHNSASPWQWKHFVQFVQQPLDVQHERLLPQLYGNEKGLLLKPGFMDGWKQLCVAVIQHATEWDEAEGLTRLSVRSWLKDRCPERKILILKPSESFPGLTEGLIKGLLYFANSVILGEMQDSRSRRLHILIDELQSYGNIEPFTAPALALYRSRGVSLSLAFQDLAQLVKIYGQEFVDFLNSNTGSIYILGVNDGFTANKLSDLLGERTIAKLHRSVSVGQGSPSTSMDEQHHQEKVMPANEFNLLGANDATKTITFLALFARQNPAYVLTAPILNYKTRSVSQPAAWMTQTPKTPPTPPDMEFHWHPTPSPSGGVDASHAPRPLPAELEEAFAFAYQEQTEDLEREFSEQTDADRLGVDFNPNSLALYRDDETEA